MNYWVVGAMFGGSEDRLPMFVRRGYWYCWDPKENQEIPKAVDERFPLIKEGDRIAVKRMLGRGSRNIEIKAIGVVSEVDHNEWRVYVRWVVPYLSRLVPMNGCAGTIHGPFSAEDICIKQVFQV